MSGGITTKMEECNPFFKKAGTGDRQYEGVTTIFGKPVVVKGKKHFQTLLKDHGMPDASPKECQQQAEYRKRQVDEEHKTRHKKQSQEFYRELKRDNIPNEVINYWVKKNFAPSGGKKWV